MQIWFFIRFISASTVSFVCIINVVPWEILHPSVEIIVDEIREKVLEFNVVILRIVLRVTATAGLSF